MRSLASTMSRPGYATAGIVLRRTPFLAWEKLVKHASIIVCSIGLMITVLAAIENSWPARAAEAPAYFKPIVGTETSSAAEIGTKNVLQLNTTMFELYGDAARIFQKNILAQTPGDPRAILG